jgi:hypothetical protein
VLAKDSEFVEDLVALLIVDFRIKRRLESRVGMRGWRLETNTADIEIFLEAIQLQEVGEFQSADISALCTDFLLEISDDRFKSEALKPARRNSYQSRSRSKRRLRV